LRNVIHATPTYLSTRVNLALLRLATYTQSAGVSHSSVLAVTILAALILLGTNAVHTTVLYFVPAGHFVSTVAWSLLYVAAFAGLVFYHGINWITWMVRYRILLVVLLLGTIASVFWSIEPKVSSIRTAHLIGGSVVAIYIGFMVPLTTILRVTAVVLGVVFLGGIVAALAVPALGQQEYNGQVVWRGLVHSKNVLGFWAAIGTMLYIAVAQSVQTFGLRMLCYLMAVVSLGLLFMSSSATSLVMLLIAGAVSLYLYIAVRFQLGFVRMVVLAAMTIGLVSMAVTHIDTTGLMGRTDDLTGRAEVWQQTWKLIMERPMTGYGYGILWFPDDATLWLQQSLTDFTWMVHHAHNGFLQIASEIGLPLSVIALLMVAQQLIEIIYCQYERQQAGVLFVLAFVLAYLVSNFSEARFLVTRELYWIYFIALPISMLRQIDVIRDEDIADEPVGDTPPEPHLNHDSTVVAGGPQDSEWANTPLRLSPLIAAGAEARPAVESDDYQTVEDILAARQRAPRRPDIVLSDAKDDPFDDTYV